MKEIEIKRKRVTESALIPFGFESTPQGYLYSEPILDGEFELKLTVTKDGAVYSQLIDTAIGDEYRLHLVPEAQGGFVGRVRSAYNAVLDRFLADCCEADVFRSAQTHAMIAYVRKKYGDELQFLWEKTPENAVLRRKDNARWYGALLVLSRRKLGYDSDERVEIIDLRMRPEQLTETVDGRRYLPGYHMNKKHWITIVLDGGVPTEEIFRRIDESYALAKK